MPTVSQLSVRISADTGDLESGLSRADNRVQGFARGAGAMGAVATAAFAGVGAAAIGLGAGFGGAVTAAAGFEATISQVAAVSGATGAELQSLSALALQMGADTSFSASEAAQAMAELAKGGIQVNQMASVLPHTLALAAAGGIGLADAATIATDSLAIFGSQGVTMEQVANAYAGAANISSISVQDMAEAMKYAGPVAASLGLTLEDTSAAVALLGANGLKGSQAGTGLRTVLTSLASPTKESAKLMRDLGINVFDSSGKMKDFAGISDELKNAMKGMTDQQRLATLETLFGREGMGAAIAMMGEGENSIQSYTDKLRNAASAQATGNKMLDNFQGSWEAFKGSIETAAITLGLAFLPALRGVVTALTGAVNAAVPFIQAWGPRLAAGLGQGIAALVAFGQRIAPAVQAALGVLLNFGRQVASAIGAVIGAFRSLLSGQTTLAQFVGGMEIWVGAVLGKLRDLGVRALPYLQAFATTVGTFIASAAPQIAAQLAIWGQRFGDWVQTTAIPWLMPRLAALLATISAWITGTALPAIGTALLAVGQAFGNWVSTTAVPYLMANLPLWYQAIMTWIGGTAIPAVTTALWGMAQAFGSWVTTTAVPWLQANLPVYLAALGAWITGVAIPTLQATLVPLAQRFGSWVTETAIPWLLENLPAWYIAIMEWLGGTALPAVTGAIFEFSKAFGDWVVTSAVPYLLENLPQWLMAINDYLTTVVHPAIGNTLITLGQKFGDWVTETAIPWVREKLNEWGAVIGEYITGTALPWLAQKATELGQAITDALRAKLEEAKTAASDAWAAIRDRAGELWATIVAAVTEKLDAIKTAVTTKLNEAKATAQQAWDAIKLGATTAWTAIQTAISTAVESVKTAITTKLNDAKTAAQQAWDSIKTTAATAWGTIAATISTAAETVKTAISTKLNEAKNAAAQVWSGIQTGAASAWGQIVLTVTNGAARILGVLQGLIGTAGSTAASIGAAIIDGIAGALQAGAGRLAEIARNVVEGALNAAKGALGIRSPSREFAELGDLSMEGFALGVENEGWRVEDAVRKTLNAALSTAINLVNQLMATMAQAANIDPTHLADPFRDTGAGLGEAIAEGMRDALDIRSPSGVTAQIGREVVAGLAQGISSTESEAVKAAAEAARAVADAIGGVFDTLTRIAGFALPAADPFRALYDLGKALRAAINDFSLLVEQVTPDAALAAGALGEQASKIGGGVARAVEAFTALLGFKWPAFAPQDNPIYQLGKALKALIPDLALVAELVTTEAIEQAAALGEALDRMLGGIGTAIEGLAALAGFVAPADAAIDAFAVAVRRLVAGIARAAREFTSGGLTLAGEFADAAGRAVGILGQGVSGLMDLARFVAPAPATIDVFVATIRQVVQRMGWAATVLDAEGTAQAERFGTAASAVLGAVRAGVDAFAVLDATNMPTPHKIDDLVRAITDVTRKVGLVAAGLGAETVAEARAFGEAAQGIFTALKSGLDLLVQIDQPGGWPMTDWLQPMIEMMSSVLQRGSVLLSQAEQLKAVADRFAATMAQAGAGFNAGMAAGGLGAGGAMPVPVANGGGGQTVIIQVTFTGNTVLGEDYATGARLARVVEPELRRLLGV